MSGPSSPLPRPGWISEEAIRREKRNPLDGVEDEELEEGYQELANSQSKITIDEIRKAGEIAKYRWQFYHSSKEALERGGSHSMDTNPSDAGATPKVNLRVPLGDDDMRALVDEREKLFSGRGMIVVILAVSLAAFLQGHVQASINAGSLFVDTLSIGLNPNDKDRTHEYREGGMNAIPFLIAAFPGAPLSLPVNYCFGRRGALLISALLIIASSLGSSFASNWYQLLGARVVGGIAMGIKAVSAPILASETAVGYWRGSTVLAWQLWVAFGIMVGSIVNLVIAHAANVLDSQPQALNATTEQSANSTEFIARYRALQYILGAPLVPAVFLIIALCFCYESPRFYMRPGTPTYNLDRAYEILLKVRKTRLLATRDFFLIWWSMRKDEVARPTNGTTRTVKAQDNDRGRYGDSGLTYLSRILVVLRLSASQFRPLIDDMILRNALWSCCIVALAQQLCGVNVFAFYSNQMFSENGVRKSMAYSFGFGAVNFFFGILAMRTIDRFGRRRLLLITLPLMSGFLMIAAIAFGVEHRDESVAGIVFIYLFAVAYSPGLGPIPFTMAAESFNSRNREAGASVAIAVNLLFAGLFTILLPSMKRKFKMAGTVGFFSGMNIVALILVFLFVEETTMFSLEELGEIFNQPKRDFARGKLQKHFPFIFGRSSADNSYSGSDDEIAMDEMRGSR